MGRRAGIRGTGLRRGKALCVMSQTVITSASFSPDASFPPYPSSSVFWLFGGFLNVTHVLNNLDGGWIGKQGASLPVSSLGGVVF